MRSRLGWAFAGMLATVVGMAAAHLIASLLVPASSPVLAVGSVVIDATPTPLKEWAIEHFGSNDKVVLIGSVLAVVLLVSTSAGLLARRRFRYGAAVIVVLVAIAATAALTRPTAGLEDAVPSLVAVVTGVLALAWLTRVGHAAHSAHESGGAVGATRRSVLLAAGVLVAFAAATGQAGRVIRSRRARPENIDLPTATDPAGSFPEGVDVKGITPLRTPLDDFYRVDTRLDTPIVESDGWTLTIDGMVDKEVVLTFDDLLAMPMIERDITLTCVSNSVGGPYIGSTRWLGVRLTDILALAGPQAGIEQIYSTDFDGMTISTPYDLATDGRDAMIVVGMDGAALPREHGFPARMLVPGLYGFISACKWIERMTLTTYDDKSAYWTDRKWATDAPIKISTRIDTPRPLDELKGGQQVIGGVAWAQQRGGIDKVQVRIDGGAWVDAELGPDVNNDYWRQWFYRWDAKPGRRTIAARAISGDGETQTAALADPFPNGASGVQSFYVDIS